MFPKLTLADINTFIACPMCKSAVVLVAHTDTLCRRCQGSYPWLAGTWDLIPSCIKSSSHLWTVWEQLQANALVGYTRDPEGNLSVGQRSDCLLFSRFCAFDGIVLDVGCGPQPWPAYFQVASAGTRFVGVDPLVDGDVPEYSRFRALGEYLPFRDKVFDHVVFATSLDHSIDPLPLLMEARRVCRGGGAIDIWIGERGAGAPKPPVSPDWYLSLSRPAGAADAFHLKRLTSHQLRAMSRLSGLRVVAEEVHVVDAFRRNCFFRLRTNT